MCCDEYPLTRAKTILKIEFICKETPEAEEVPALEKFSLAWSADKYFDIIDWEGTKF